MEKDYLTKKLERTIDAKIDNIEENLEMIVSTVFEIASDVKTVRFLDFLNQESK